MGKGGKNNQKPGKKAEQQPLAQPEEEPSEDFDEQDSEDQQEDDNPILDDISNEDEQLLNKIQDEIIGSEQNVKLTWAAIHNLKSKEKLLNEEMDQEMRKIKEKYDKLKQPLIHKIALAASGEKVEEQLYSKHELTKSLSLKKFKAKAIPGFWRNVFDSISLLTCIEERQIFDKCTKVVCNCTSDQQKDQDTFQIIMQFEENQYFSNKQLKLKVQRIVTSANVIQVSKIQFKKPQQGQLFIAQLFDPYTEPYKLYEYANDIQRAYNSSLFFYFFQSKLDQLDEQVDNDGSEDQNDDESDEDDEEEDIGQPIKKRKPNEEIVEKPNCQNQ